MPKFNVAKVAPGEKFIWVVSDTGTYRLNRELTEWWENFPPVPMSDKARSIISRGFWYALWKAESSRFIQKTFLDEGSIWVISLGTLYRLGTETQPYESLDWTKVLKNAFQVQKDEDSLWILTTKGVVRYDKSSGQMTTYTTADGLADGRAASLLVTNENVWVLTKPNQEGKGGGISRFDKKKGKWFSYPSINGQKANFATFIGKIDGDVWAATQNYDELVTKFLHPGMAHVKSQLPHVIGLSVHRYLPQPDGWETITGEVPKKQKRFILGHTGHKKEDAVGPELITNLVRFKDTLLSVFRVVPENYYAGYYPTIGRFAHRIGTEWKFSIEDYASQLGLQGEQPEVMLLSRNHGKQVVVAEGHYNVLGLERAGNVVWVVTEGGLAYYSYLPAPSEARQAGSDNKWVKVVNIPHRFYWGVTAAAADAQSVWFGADRGLLTKLDKKTETWTTPFRFAGRKISKLAIDKDGALCVKTVPFEKGNLPKVLASIPEIKSNGLAVFDGEKWTEASGKMPSQQKEQLYRWSFKDNKNFLYQIDTNTKGEKKVAYLKGVYQPSVLVADTYENVLWVKTYDGVARIDLSGM